MNKGAKDVNATKGAYMRNWQSHGMCELERNPNSNLARQGHKGRINGIPSLNVAQSEVGLYPFELSQQELGGKAMETGTGADENGESGWIVYLLEDGEPNVVWDFCKVHGCSWGKRLIVRFHPPWRSYCPVHFHVVSQGNPQNPSYPYVALLELHFFAQPFHRMRNPTLFRRILR